MANDAGKEGVASVIGIQKDNYGATMPVNSLSPNSDQHQISPCDQCLLNP